MTTEPMEVSLNAKPNLDCLPYEMTVMILDNLSIQQIIHLRRVCKHLKTTIDEYLITVRVLAIYRHGGEELKKLSSMRQAMNLDMDSILRSTIRLPQAWKVDDSGYDLASIIPKFFPNLTELYLMNSRERWPVNELVTAFPGLKKLAVTTIPGIDGVPEESINKRFIESLYEFESLETLIVMCSTQWRPEFHIKRKFLQQLRHMRLSGIINMQQATEQPTNVEYQDLPKMALESITLNRLDMELITNVIQLLSADNFPNLKHVLVLWGSLSDYRELFQANKSIESIQISSDEYPEEVEPIFETLNAFPELKLLHINVEYFFEFFEDFCENFLSSLAGYMPNFTHLETILFDFGNVYDWEVFDESFIQPLQSVSGGSVKKIVLQSIDKECHEIFQYFKPDFSHVSYQIEIVPAKFFF